MFIYDTASSYMLTYILVLAVVVVSFGEIHMRGSLMN
jgi:hypothetical protein